jgi:trehalose/maltose hydrolase-like predicted phosphorylase
MAAAVIASRGLSGNSASTVATLPPSLARRFDALVFDWDGTAVTDRAADASAVREVVEALCAAGVHIAIVSGTHVGNVDGQLSARPSGPGRLFLALNRGSELFEVGVDGPRVVARREATPYEDAALTRAAEKVVARLSAHGLEAKIVSQRLNRRKIDLIPLPEWDDPPKAMIDKLLVAVQRRLRDAGIDGLVAVAQLATEIAVAEGLEHPKITSDAKHVEVGLTDKADSSDALFAELWRLGIDAELTLIGGDEFGPLGDMPGSDALMLTPEVAAATVFSVGVEPSGVPPGVVHVAGGPATFLALLEDQLRRRADVPRVAARAGWSLVFDGFEAPTSRARESLLTLADGVIGTSGAPLFEHAAARRDVLASGIYDGVGSDTDLLAGPEWARLGWPLNDDDDLHRVLDLHTGVLAEFVRGAVSLESARFSTLARPGVVALRAEIDPADASPPLSAPDECDVHAGTNGHDWMVTRGTGGSIAAAAAQQRERTRLDRIAAYATGSDDEVLEHATLELERATAAGFDVLLDEQRRAWAARWERADVRIEGDDELQHAIRVSLFHLMAAAGDHGEAVVGARGLTGRAYRGHVFWDADLFVLPFLAATHPQSARAMLEYRIARLPQALARAAAEGRAGARFPWESAGDGTEVTPHAGRDHSGRVVPIRTGDNEIHIVGDVVWAALYYAQWTGDEEFLAGPGLRLLIETARYWASRIRVDPQGHGHIYGVIGPDEYHEPVDDNAYTNVLARWNLRRAADMCAWFGDQSVTAVECARWISLADALVDGYQPDTGIYEEFAGFFTLEPIRVVDIVERRPVTADLLLGRDRVRNAQILKQADVLMLHHLLPDEVEPGSLVPNLEYYEPRTAHGSSLSPGIHASLFARAHRLDEAVEALRLAAKIDLADLTATSGGGLHLATMGGVWQAIAYGFLGLRPRRDVLVIDPRLPDQWREIEVRVVFLGNPVRIRVDRDNVVLDADAPLTIELAGNTAHCRAGETTFPFEPGGAR